jgi:hypothetical protein
VGDYLENLCHMVMPKQREQSVEERIGQSSGYSDFFVPTCISPGSLAIFAIPPRLIAGPQRSLGIVAFL